MNDSFSKSIILLRGLPGSGKSTLAGILSENGKYPVHCVDDYFTNPDTGEYHFEFEKNYLAYKSCEENTTRSLEDKIPKVFVANTFTMEWEMEPYFLLAKQYEYSIFVLTVENRHEGINIHGITQEQLEKMASKYKVKLINHLPFK